MFRAGGELDVVVGNLAARQVSLWHACQLIDFESYIAVGGIPSRSLLEQARLPFTGFVTDASDRSARVWSKVFVNLSDFGWSFAHGLRAVPNPYGPIVFQIRPSALARAADAAFCLRSAGARDFDRDAESLDSTGDIERLFVHSPTWSFPESAHVRVGFQLRGAFAPRFPEASAAEVSMTMDPELIPLEDVIAVWVDPVVVLDGSLENAVKELVPPGQRVRQRYVRDDRRIVLSDIVNFLTESTTAPSLRLLAGRARTSGVTREWARTLLERDLDWQFQRYARYLLEGTLRQLGASQAAVPHLPGQADVPDRSVDGSALRPT